MTVKQFVYVIISQTTGGPGVYAVQTPGVTITLENWGYWQDRNDYIVIKDVTGSATPNITVNAPPGGLIDNVATMQMTRSNEGLIFRPLSGGNTYLVTG